MRRSSFIIRRALPAFVLCCWWTSPAWSQDERPEWKAGAASVVITPRQPMWMAGYAARNKPSEGTAQDLYAKALALEDTHGTRIVIVTSDLIGILRSLRDAVVERVAESHKLPPEAVLLNASHTHCGPEYRGREGREEKPARTRSFSKTRSSS